MEEERDFSGRLNTDDEERKIPNGDFHDCKYLREGSAESGLAGVKSTFSGNELLDFGSLLPGGTNTMIGSCTATDINSIIYVYHNSNGDHSIVILNTINDTWAMVMQSQVFKFDLNFPCYDVAYLNGLVRITDGKDDATFFTGAVVSDPLESTRLFNSPIRINVQAAIDGEYTTIDLRSIEVLKWPFWYPPLVEYISVPDVPNKLRKGLYEFIQCPGYADDEWGPWSQVSPIPYPTQSDWVSGIDYSTPFIDNCIQVTYETGPYRVRKIRLAFRVNKGSFYRFIEIDKDLDNVPDDSTGVYQFFNNTVNIVVAEGGGIAPPSEQSCPQTTLRAEMLPTNQDCFGNYYEGYDNFEVDYDLENVAIEIPNMEEDYVNMFVTNSVGGAVNISIQFDSYTYFNVSPGDTYVLGVSNIAPTTRVANLFYAVTEDDIALALLAVGAAAQLAVLLEIIGDAFVAQINDALGTVVTGAMFSSTEYRITVGAVSFRPIARGSLDPVIPQRKDDAIQCGRWGWTYYLGIIGQDRGGRDGTVQAPESMRMLKIPFPSQEAARQAFVNPNSPYYNRIRMTINSLPPIEFDTYSVAVKKVAGNFQMRTVVGIDIDPNHFNTINLTLDPWYEEKYRANISGSIQVGDLVRFVTKNKASDLQELNEYMDSYQEFEVLHYDPSSGTNPTTALLGAEQIVVTKFDTTTILNTNSSYSPTIVSTGQLVEIYTPPLVEDDGVWFKIATFGIGKAHTDDRYFYGELGPEHSVRGGGGLGTFLFTTTDDPGVFDPDGRRIRLMNDDGDVQENVITFTEDLGGGIFRINLTDATEFNFSNANGGTYGIYQDQIVVQDVSGPVVVSPAILDLDWGDVTYRQRDMGTGFQPSSLPQHSYSYCLDPSRSDYWPSNFYHLGQPCLKSDENRRIHRETGLIHSQKYLVDTLINGLSNFIGLDNRETLFQRWGGITRIKVDKMTIHCVLPRVTIPIYMGGTYASTQDGAEAQPAFANKTFGGVGREVNYGSVHPGSVKLRTGGVLVMYDYYNGAVVELTDGGAFDITETNSFKFKTGIMELTSRIEEDFESYANSVFVIEDKANSEIIFHAWNNSVSPDERWGATFNYVKRKWDYRVDYPLVWGENLGTYLTSTDGTLVYKHNEGNELQFYGVNYGPMIEYPCNTNSNVIKRAYAMGLKSNARFNVSSILVASSVAYPSGMSSRLPAAKFVIKENFLWAEYLKDQSNVVTGVTHLATAQLALVNGRELRGPSWMHIMEITPVDDPIERVILYGVKIVFDLSLQAK